MPPFGRGVISPLDEALLRWEDRSGRLTIGGGASGQVDCARQWSAAEPILARERIFCSGRLHVGCAMLHQRGWPTGDFAMRIVRTLALTVLLGAALCPAIPAANAQVGIGISINIEPPPLPVYDQPIIPGPGYLWTPGYWAWNADVDDYYWVPGTWVLPPQPGVLWTPGYWAWNDGVYAFNDGYWGPEIGFSGGVNYGFGYGGAGYEGGYWNNGAFFYNRTVNNISSVAVTNVYSKTVVVNNASKASFNGGAGGTTVKPTSQQLALAKERHIPPTQEQTRHVQTAAKDPALSLTKNQGHPSIAATAQPGQLKGPGVIAAHPGKPVVLMRPATPGNAAGTPGTPSNAGAPSKPGTPSHALPGFSQQPGGKPGPAGTGTTGPSTATTGLGTTGPGTAGDKKKKIPSSSGSTTPGTTTLTPAIAKPVTPSTAHTTPSTAVHTPPPPVVHQPPPPPKPAQSLVAKPVMPTPHAGPPPPHAGPPPAKPKCTPGQPCR
jgi:hypothetical protein